MNWFLFAAATVIILVGAFVLFSGFADVPCQGGAWDAAKQTCVPY